MNDEERRQWVLNDEGLYLWWKQSRIGSIREFIRQNRKEIDEAINNVTSGRKRQHYLRYG